MLQRDTTTTAQSGYTVVWMVGSWKRIYSWESFTTKGSDIWSLTNSRWGHVSTFFKIKVFGLNDGHIISLNSVWIFIFWCVNFMLLLLQLLLGCRHFCWSWRITCSLGFTDCTFVAIEMLVLLLRPVALVSQALINGQFPNQEIWLYLKCYLLSKGQGSLQYEWGEIVKTWLFTISKCGELHL